MARNLRKFATIAEYEQAELIKPAVSLIEETDGVYFDQEEVITGVTPTFGVAQEISAYTSTTFNDVYQIDYNDESNSKWYKKNNTNQYEEYGVYGDSTGATATTYDGKLAIVNNVEYEYSGSSWTNIGNVSASTAGVSFTKELSQNTSQDFNGATIPTSFKILKSEVDAIIPLTDYQTFSIEFLGPYDQTTTSYSTLMLSIDDQGNTSYSTTDGTQGTVTDDGTYYICELQGVDYFDIESIGGSYYVGTSNLIFTGAVIGVKASDPSYSQPSALYNGVTMPTKFKIPSAEVDALVQGYGSFSLTIGSSDYMTQMVVTDSTYQIGQDYGTVTLNGDFYEYDIASPSTFEIGDMVCYGYDTFVHLYVGGSSSTYPKYYAEKSMPTLSRMFTSASAMSEASDTFYGQYSVIAPTRYDAEDSTTYIFTTANTWVETDDFKMTGLYGTNKANVIPTDVATVGEIQYKHSRPWWITDVGISSVKIGGGVTALKVQYTPSYKGSFEGCALKNVVIPDSVTEIGLKAFNNCNSLSSCTIGSGVTIIKSNAFQDCFGLNSVDIPNSVTKIDDSAFKGCESLTAVTFGSGLTEINSGAFNSCTGLTSIDIPSGITKIGQSAFYNCTSLTSITVNATTPPTLMSSAFTNTNNCPIYVPAASVDTYKAASIWSTYASRIQAISS